MLSSTAPLAGPPSPSSCATTPTSHDGFMLPFVSSNGVELNGDVTKCENSMESRLDSTVEVELARVRPETDWHAPLDGGLPYRHQLLVVCYQLATSLTPSQTSTSSHLLPLQLIRGLKCVCMSVTQTLRQNGSETNCCHCCKPSSPSLSLTTRPS